MVEQSDFAVPASSGKQTLIWPDTNVCNALLFNVQGCQHCQQRASLCETEALDFVVSSSTDTTYIASMPHQAVNMLCNFDSMASYLLASLQIDCVKFIVGVRVP